jgi:hypothetical protein
VDPSSSDAGGLANIGEREPGRLVGTRRLELFDKHGAHLVGPSLERANDFGLPADPSEPLLARHAGPIVKYRQPFGPASVAP